MKLSEIFEQNKDIVINTDIDGILSGIILQQYYGCNIVGFSNSNDIVWLCSDIQSVYAPVYIDMFVPQDNVICIEQHIVAVNEAQHNHWLRCGTKINPNLTLQKRIFTLADYKLKYPFGTIHYIIALMESEGMPVNLPNLNTVVDASLNIQLGDLLLRADDAMKTTCNSPYMTNAQQWWNRLTTLSHNATSIQTMIQFLNNIPAANVDNIKTNTKEYFKQHFHCCTSDGGFNRILDKTNALLPNIQTYIDTIAQVMGTTLRYPTQLVPHYGTAKQVYWNSQWEKEFVNHQTINGEKVFSYSFIYSPSGQKPNFSYTTQIK